MNLFGSGPIPFPPYGPFSTGGLIHQGPGVLRKNSQSGQTVQPIKGQRNPDAARLCIANGVTPLTVTTNTVLPLETVVSDHEDPTIDETKLAILASNTLTVKRTGWLLVTYNATFGYSNEAGVTGLTNKEVQIKAWVEAGGQAMTPSDGWTTLSSRLNLTNKVECTSEDGIIFYHGEDTEFIVSTPDSDEPTGWHGSATAQGTWLTWTFEQPTGDNLENKGAPILTNMSPIASYESSTVTKQTVSGQCMVQCSAFDATTNKFLISAVEYAAELKIKATRTYAGEGTNEPVVRCLSLTVSVLRIA